MEQTREFVKEIIGFCGSEKYISRLAKRGLATCSYKLAGLMPQIKKPGINSHATE
jgi:hypothetical protein